MKTLIIEDEIAAANNLKRIIKESFPDVEIVAIEQTVVGALNYLNNNKDIDIILSDIQLSDGLSFEIFENIQVDIPIIFTTAFDEYALRAFNVQSIDYLLKPISPVKLQRAFNKYQNLTSKSGIENVSKLISDYSKNAYKQRFLVKFGSQFKSIASNEIAYFYKEDYIMLVTVEGKEYPLNYTLDEIEKVVKPDTFIRVNRQFIISANCISKIYQHSKSRIKLILNPGEKELVISNEKTSDFKNWIDR